MSANQNNKTNGEKLKKSTLKEFNELKEEVQQLRKANQEQWTELRQTLADIKLDYAKRLDELTKKYNAVIIKLLNANGEKK